MTPWEPEFFVAYKYNYEAIAEEFLNVLDETQNRPIYVHCQHGRDRTGSMLSIYRIAREGWGWREAVEDMKRYGFNTFYYANLVHFVKEYDNKLSGTRDL